jgi:hypothetical protein
MYDPMKMLLNLIPHPFHMVCCLYDILFIRTGLVPTTVDINFRSVINTKIVLWMKC